MSRLNYLVREAILFVGSPWRATADLVGGRVFSMLNHFDDERKNVLGEYMGWQRLVGSLKL